MTWYEMAGDWREFSAMVRTNWGKLTDDDLTTFGGSSDDLAGILGRRYGYSKDEARREITEFATRART